MGVVTKSMASEYIPPYLVAHTDASIILSPKILGELYFLPDYL